MKAPYSSACRAGLILLGALIVLGAIAYHLAAWVVAGKDPAPGTIVPLFHPPEGFSPAACRSSTCV